MLHSLQTQAGCVDGVSRGSSHDASIPRSHSSLASLPFSTMTKISLVFYYSISKIAVPADGSSPLSFIFGSFQPLTVCSALISQVNPLD